jgi:hypothetical protein
MPQTHSEKSTATTSRAVAHQNTSGAGLSQPAVAIFYISPAELSAPVAGPPVQRTVTQIFSGDDNKINRLLIVGRPERAFNNSMGDHTTAFATHVEAIKLRMEGKTLKDALTGLGNMYMNAKALPGYALKGNLPGTGAIVFGFGPHGDRLAQAESGFDTLYTTALSLSEGEPAAFALTLQECVNAYLEFRELIPLSAVNVMSVAPALAGKGKGEAGYATVLAGYESGKTPADRPGLQAAIKGTFDAFAAAMVVAATDNDTLSGLAPGLTITITPKKRIELLADQHMAAIKAGFPKSFAAAEMGAAELENVIIPLAGELMKKNRALLVNRLTVRVVKLKELETEFNSGIDKTKYNKDYRASLALQINDLNVQIAAINDVLGDAAAFKMEEKPVIASVALEAEKNEGVKKEEDTTEAKKQEEKAKETEENKQPIASQIIMVDAGIFGYKIKKLKVAGRPPSPISGSMGAHSTAWVVHTDRVSKALTGLDIGAAINAMNSILVPEAITLATALEAANPPVVGGQLDLAATALSILKAREGKLAEDKGNLSKLAFGLQQYVNELFTYINYIPGVTRVAVNTDGRGEGTHRKVLNEYEDYIDSRLKKWTPKPRQTRADRPRTVNLTETQVREIMTAINGLLDLNGLSEQDVYKDVHRDMISKVYPLIWKSLPKK